MRIAVAVLAVIVAGASFVLARIQLAILDGFEASAIQVTQVHAEAQTDLQVGILFLLALVVLALVLPEPKSSVVASSPAPLPEASADQ